MDRNFNYLKEAIEKDSVEDSEMYFYYLGCIHGLSLANGISRQQAEELRAILKKRRKQDVFNHKG